MRNNKLLVVNIRFETAENELSEVEILTTSAILIRGDLNLHTVSANRVFGSGGGAGGASTSSITGASCMRTREVRPARRLRIYVWTNFSMFEGDHNS